VGGYIDEVWGQRCILAGFPIRWVGGDGSMVRLVAIIEE
jgi:kynurenine formamidase